MKITIHWSAFAKYKPTRSLAFEIDEVLDAMTVLEEVFDQTNRYVGKWWDLFESRLPADRSHTALSPDDEVTIERVISIGGKEFEESSTYRCEHVGWTLLKTSIQPHVREVVSELIR